MGEKTSREMAEYRADEGGRGSGCESLGPEVGCVFRSRISAWSRKKKQKLQVVNFRVQRPHSALCCSLLTAAPVQVLGWLRPERRSHPLMVGWKL